MPIETTCQTCGQRLRVADEHAGKSARCPGCQTIYTVPQPAVLSQPLAWQPPPIPAAGAPAGSDRWHLRTPDGLTYGPIPKAELDQWMQQGRILAQSQVLCEGDGQWVWAGKVYPQLGSFAEAPLSQPLNPYAAPTAINPYGWPTSPYREQHRGPVVLTLAIVGIFVCDIVSLIAIIMAIIDLSKMSQGTMDPSGRGLTIAGLIIASLKVLALVLIFGAIFLANAF
jgi:GYF domain 2